MKKNGFTIIIMFLIATLSYSGTVPVEKSYYLFRNSDIADAAMGNTGFIFSGKNSVDTNPATMSNLDKAYYYLGYNHSDYADGIDITESKNYKTINYFGVSSPTGGFYYRRLKRSGEVLGETRKYGFISNEIGIASANTSDSIKGISIGTKLKVYVNELDDAKVESTELKLSRELGYGYAVDLSMAYKISIFSMAINAENVLGNIYWNKYDNIYINPVIKAGTGLELGILKYGVSAERIIKKGVKTRYGQGVELTLANVPVEYPSIFKGVTVKARAGVTSDNFFGNKNSKKSYGLELVRGKYYMDLLTESSNLNIFTGDDNKIYKIAIGIAQ